MRNVIRRALISLVLFSQKLVFNEKDNINLVIFVIAERELDDTIIDGIGNLEDLPRLVFTDEECGNLMVVNDGELTRNINQKRKSDVSEATKCSLCGKCCRREYSFNKHEEYCESVT